MTRLPRKTSEPGSGPATDRSGVQRFCKECGAPLAGARFCPQCGAATENAGPDAGQHRAEPQRGGWRWPVLVAAGVTAMIVIGLVAALVLARGSPSGVSYVSQARRIMTPVIEQNRRLAGVLSALSAHGGVTRAQGSVQRTIDTTRSARRSLSRLNAGPGDRPLAIRTQTALTSELAWLDASASVLARPAGPVLSQLRSLNADAHAKLAAIADRVPDAPTSLPGSARLIAYAQARNGVRTRGALSQFSDQVQALLNQSGPAFEQINRLFGQMQAAASGGTPTISLPQAEAIITSVISNRTALAASARTLTAPTPGAVAVRDGLVAAMDASLTDDHGISDCLNQANNGTVAFIFQGCLSSTAAASDAATAAKQHFLAEYNTLRSQLGLPAISVQF